MMLMPTTCMSIWIAVVFPISGIVVNGRPIRHHRQIARIERLKFFGCINRFSAQNSEHGLQRFDFLVRNCEVVVGQHRQIGELPRRNCTAFSLPRATSRCCPGVQPEGFLPRRVNAFSG